MIFAYFLMFSVVRLPINLVVARVVGRIGPKHTIGLSTLAEVVFMLMLVTIEQFSWPLLFLASLHTFTNALFFTAYHVDFSKIKQTRDAGKEVGHMLLLQKIFGMIGPFLGGLLATLIDFRVSIAFSIGLLLLSLIPLFMSKEPVRLHQHITYKGLSSKLWRRRRNVLAIAGFNMSTIISSTVWVVFISLAVFTENTYADIGLLLTVSTILSALLAKYIGHKTDTGSGPNFIRLGALSGLVLNASKLFIVNPVAVAAEGVAETQAALFKQVPMNKGFYAESDDFPGQRIAYVSVVEIIVQALRIPFWILLIVALAYFDDDMQVLRITAATAGFVGLLSLGQNFKSLRNTSKK